MAQDAPEAQTEGKTYLAHRLGALPTELFDKILFNIDAIRDLAHFITTARFVYRRFKIQRELSFFVFCKTSWVRCWTTPGSF